MLCLFPFFPACQVDGHVEMWERTNSVACCCAEQKKGHDMTLLTKECFPPFCFSITLSLSRTHTHLHPYTLLLKHFPHHYSHSQRSRQPSAEKKKWVSGHDRRKRRHFRKNIRNQSPTESEIFLQAPTTGHTITAATRMRSRLCSGQKHSRE